jgi:hypothetical protein
MGFCGHCSHLSADMPFEAAFRSSICRRTADSTGSFVHARRQLISKRKKYSILLQDFSGCDALQ